MSGTGSRREVIRRNLAVIGAAYAVAMLAGFAAQAFLARQLGQAVFGEYVAAFSLLTILAVAFELGSSDYLVREGARQPSKLAQLVSDVLSVRVAASGAVAALAMVIGTSLGFTSRELAVTALMTVVFAANALAKPFRSGLQTIERMEIASALSIANAVLSAAAMIALVAAGFGLVAAVAGSAAVSIVLVPASWLALARRAALPLRWSFGRLRESARSSVPFTAVNFMAFATSYADALIIRALLGAAATGAYGAAYRLFAVLQFLPSIYVDSVYRTASSLAHGDSAEFGRFVERSAAALLVLALPLAAGGVVLADQIMELVFGSDFADGSSDAFAVLLLSLPLSFPLWLLLLALMVGERPQRAAWLLLVALTGNVVANVVLLPTYGIEAAAWTTVATDAFTALAITRALRGSGVGLRWVALGARAVPPALLTAAVALALRPLPLPVPLAAGAVVYAGGLLALGVPSRLGLRQLR